MIEDHTKVLVVGRDNTYFIFQFVDDTSLF